MVTVADDPKCSFCGEGKSSTRRLIKGPQIYICEPCVDKYYVGNGLAIKIPARRCCFCKEEQSEEVDLMGLWVQRRYVCRECLMVMFRLLHPKRVEVYSTSFALWPRATIDERYAALYVDIVWSYDGVKSDGVSVLRYVDGSRRKPRQDIILGAPKGMVPGDTLLAHHQVAEIRTMDVTTHPLYQKARELILEVTGFERLWR